MYESRADRNILQIFFSLIQTAFSVCITSSWAYNESGLC